MITYGEFFKKLRVQRGFQISEVYGGILSRTSAYRFEHGNGEVSAEKLGQLLYNIGIFSLDEFTFLYNQFNHLPPQNIDMYTSTLITEDDLSSPESIARSKSMAFYNQYKNSSKKEEKFYAYLVHYNCLVNWQPEFNPPKEFELEYKFMQDYLLNIESWGLRELENFGFLSGCFDSKTRRILLPRFKANFHRYQGYFSDWADHYATNLVNYAINTASKKDYQDLPSELIDITKLMHEHPRLNWNIVHLIRYWYIQILTAAVQDDLSGLQEKYQRLIDYAASVPEVSDITGIYIEMTRKNVLEINQSLESKLSKIDAYFFRR